MKATEFLEKILVAERPVTVYYGHPGSADNYTVNKNREIGRIYSYVQQADGLYWQIYTNEGTNDVFVKHDRDRLDIRERAISISNLTKEFLEFTGFGDVAQGGFEILKLAVIGLVAFAAIKVSGLFD